MATKRKVRTTEEVLKQQKARAEREIAALLAEFEQRRAEIFHRSRASNYRRR